MQAQAHCFTYMLKIHGHLWASCDPAACALSALPSYRRLSPTVPENHVCSWRTHAQERTGSVEMMQYT